MIQWGTFAGSTSTKTVSFLVEYTNIPCVVTGAKKTNDNYLGGVVLKSITEKTFTYKTATHNEGDPNTTGFYVAIGN